MMPGISSRNSRRAILEQNGESIFDLVHIECLRSVLEPVGHGVLIARRSRWISYR
jgi:hypothetical protein